jgi:hypothetical protein
MPPHFKFSLFRCEQTANGSIDGEIAQGVVFSNGKVALAFLVGGCAVSVYDDFGAMYKTHCQDGKSRLLWGYSEMAHSADLLPSFSG